MKILGSVISGLILLVIVGLFNFRSRLIQLEAKSPPVGFNSRLVILETRVPAIEETHRVAKKSIKAELTYIRGRVDNIYTLLTKP